GVFFFSSRRRHTSSKRDWSSDVCSSDLVLRVRVQRAVHALAGILERGEVDDARHLMVDEGFPQCSRVEDGALDEGGVGVDEGGEIGRASCRERGGRWEGA